VKLLARILALGDESTRTLLSLLPANARALKSGRYALDVTDPLFRRVLEAGDTARGFWVGGEAVWSATELASFTHYEVASRFVLRESKADFDANDAVRASTPLIDAGGAAPVRLMSGLFLSRVTLKPNMVGSVGDWTEEYVGASGAVNAFKDARLSGAEVLPVTHPKTGVAHDNCFQLYCEALLPPVIIDDSVETIVSRHPEENGRLRHLGCLAYPSAALADRPDFNRTAEPWGGWHGWPTWVVSARVAATFKAAKLRGWHFRPVLTLDSDSYRTYNACWQILRDALAATKQSKCDGSRW
jgi:hypothetical protein